MDTKQPELKKAISILYDMELNNYKMTKSIHRLNYEISCLGNEKRFSKPSEPRYPNLPREPNGCLFTIAGAIIGPFAGLLFSFSSENFFTIFFSLILGSIICGLIGYFIEIAINEAKKEDLEEQIYHKEINRYESAMRNYRNSIAFDKKRVEKELKQKEILIAERDALIKRRNKSQEILNGFYMRVGIDKMFRSLIPIGKMNEIIGLNITSSLEGQNGLNDRVRKELREDAFYIKLDEISQKLDVVISKQDRIYNELMSIHSQCENLIDATIQSAQIAANNNKLLSEAVENTRIAAYNSERIAIEENYQSFLMTYKF